MQQYEIGLCKVCKVTRGAAEMGFFINGILWHNNAVQMSVIDASQTLKQTQLTNSDVPSSKIVYKWYQKTLPSVVSRTITAPITMDRTAWEPMTNHLVKCAKTCRCDHFKIHVCQGLPSIQAPNPKPMQPSTNDCSDPGKGPKIPPSQGKRTRSFETSVRFKVAAQKNNWTWQSMSTLAIRFTYRPTLYTFCKVTLIWTIEDHVLVRDGSGKRKVLIFHSF